MTVPDRSSSRRSDGGSPTDGDAGTTGRDWHAFDLDALYDRLDASSDGLATEEAAVRLERYGANEVEGEEGVSPLRILLEQYTSILIWLLIVAAAVMAAVGYTLDAGVIVGIVVFITVFGFVQDYRAEQSIAALKEMAATEAVALRDGHRSEVDARTLVPGDVVFVAAGDVVPADGRILEESNLSVDESALTGESVGASKERGVVDPDTPLADRTNAVYRETTVDRGTATVLVTETGQTTEIGQIATSLEEAEERDTPFQTEMDRLGTVIGAGVVGIVTVIAITELVIGDTDPFTVFLTAVGIAVSAVPEGLPAVVTLSLALGARRMAAKNALVRRLPIVEALGSVDVICTDKTGTLTEEEMTVQRLYANGETYEVTGTGYDTDGEILRRDEPASVEHTEELLRCGLLCTNVEVGRRGETGGDNTGGVEPGDETAGMTYLGDPTEIALYIAALKAGFDRAELAEAYPRVGEVDFTSERKRMTTVHRTPDGGTVAYMKGAPEIVVERCDREFVDGAHVELTDERRTEILQTNESFAADALRVMGFAFRPDVPEDAAEEVEQEMVFLGLQGMLDPPRPEVPEALAGCLNAGINVVMITGDNAVTARAIGEKIGLRSATVVTGPELDGMTDETLADVVDDVDIFARTAPEHKTRILQTLQANGHTVAMTGDGVNDAPAVRNADVGVAMGVRGTDVTEQASDIVLLDDNFATIRDAVREGRRIFDNVRKFVNYLLSGNGGEVTMIFSGSMLGFGLVITPIQILWINVVTDGIPAMTLGFDPAADDVMDRQPRPRDEGVITDRIVTSIVGIAIFMTVTILPLFYIHRDDIVLAQTMVFTSFVVFEIVRLQAIRWRYDLGLFSNRWLVFAIVIAFGLQLAVLYTPIGALFGATPLAAIHWLQIGTAAAVFVALMALFVTVQDRYFDRY